MGSVNIYIINCKESTVFSCIQHTFFPQKQLLEIECAFQAREYTNNVSVAKASARHK